MPTKKVMNASFGSKASGKYRMVNGPIDDDEEIIFLLQQCCARRLPAKIVFSDFVLRCRFFSAAGESVTFEVLDIPQRTVEPKAPCSVSLVYEGTSSIFLSETIAPQSEQTGKLPTVTLQRPGLIDGPERREAVRIPVVQKSGLTIRLQKGKSTWEAALVDLSFSGMQVQFPEKVAIKKGDSFLAEITSGKYSIQLQTQVQRVMGSRSGLAIIDTEKNKLPDQRHQLKKIIKNLEQAWIKRQYRSWAMTFGRHPLPEFPSHQESVCNHCGKELSNFLGTSNPAGFGKYVAECKECLLFTWYDLVAQ